MSFFLDNLYFNIWLNFLKFDASDNAKKDDDDEGAGGAAGAGTGDKAQSFEGGNQGEGSGGGQKEEKTDRESTKRSHSHQVNHFYYLMLISFDVLKYTLQWHHSFFLCQILQCANCCLLAIKLLTNFCRFVG